MAIRTLVVDDVSWTIWDTYPSSDARRRMTDQGASEGWLTFECAHEKRRLVPVPDGWDAWSDERLRLTLGTAERIQQRPSTLQPLVDS